ncbi:hypothetical protein [Phytohabitans suffuscus]|uniref:Uncharacterized protein n=1 Tax=Phytohabitans suffuscus TaxID=624315 RepID=A0A6F8YPN2_9ACTN|nr:hypothetical protein [Phytohabitans suffuscus]BCB88135.1 hypothetical protein Psuf_054480 [Phytohabitans suffuscus]
MVVFAAPAGRYQITCVTSSDGDPPTLSIGDPPRYDGPRERALTTLARVGLTAAGLLVGGLIAGVVAVRRRTNRSRPQPESNAVAS